MVDKLRDGGRGRKPVRSAQQADDTGFDASPQGDLSTTEPKAKPKNIQETKLWKDGTGGARRFWSNYLTLLSTAFKRLTRRGQEELIIRVSTIVSVGTAIITLNAWYWFLPQFVRVLALPVVAVGSWWLGTRIVGPSMIERFASHLNPPE